VTNVPRSLAAALSPALAGALFSAAVFPWPLLIGGSLLGVVGAILAVPTAAILQVIANEVLIDDPVEAQEAKEGKETKEPSKK